MFDSAEMIEMQFARLREWSKGGRPGPWEVVFFPTNRCNQRCVHCWQRRAEEETEGIQRDELSDARLLEMVDEAHALDARYCYIVGGGEPMIRAGVVMEMCEKIRGYGMFGTLHSNGALFSRNHLEHLVRIGWDEVIISLDAPDAETNDALRGTGAFDRVIRNIKRLTEIRHQFQTEKPRVALNMVVTNTNFDKLDGMVQLAHDLECKAGLSCSMILPLNDECARLELSEEQRAQFPRHIRRAVDLADRLKVKNMLDTLLPKNQKQAQAAPDPRLQGQRRFSGSLCFEACLSLVITADGLTGPCCMSWAKEAPDVREQSLSEIWYGPYFENLRRCLQNYSDVPGFCRDCPDQLLFSTRNYRTRLELEESLKGRLILLSGHIRKIRGRRTREALKRLGRRLLGLGEKA